VALEALAASLPPYAKDVAANLVAIAGETLLSDQQKWGCFVASANAVATPVALQPSMLPPLPRACRRKPRLSPRERRRSWRRTTSTFAPSP